MAVSNLRRDSRVGSRTSAAQLAALAQTQSSGNANAAVFPCRSDRAITFAATPDQGNRAQLNGCRSV